MTTAQDVALVLSVGWLLGICTCIVGAAIRDFVDGFRAGRRAARLAPKLPRAFVRAQRDRKLELARSLLNRR
jgi:hypothetical protein